MFSDPVHNVRQVGIIPGHDIADIGAGTGHYTLAAARHLGFYGRIYAIDIREEPLVRLKNEARKQGLYNVETIAGDIENGIPLPDRAVHLAFICNIFPHIENRTNLISEVSRILYPFGRVLVVGEGLLPGKNFEKEKVYQMFAPNFQFDREIAAGAHHYGLIFRKNIQ